MADDMGLVVSIVFSIMILAVALAFFVGRISDPIWKAKILRMVDRKKNYYLIGFVSKSGNHIRDKIIDIEHAVLEHRGKMWVADRGRIFDESNPDNGFFIGGKPRLWEEGVPRLFVNDDDFMPMTFFESQSHVKPDEIGSELKAWVDNQIAKAIAQFAKAFASIKNHQMLLWICIVIGIAAVGFAFINMQAINNLQMSVNTLQTQVNQTARIVIEANPAAAARITKQQTLPNGTIVITG